jgi:hypothetical protein
MHYSQETSPGERPVARGEKFQELQPFVSPATQRGGVLGSALCLTRRRPWPAANGPECCDARRRPSANSHRRRKPQPAAHPRMVGVSCVGALPWTVLFWPYRIGAMHDPGCGLLRIERERSSASLKTAGLIFLSSIARSLSGAKGGACPTTPQETPPSVRAKTTTRR